MGQKRGAWVGAVVKLLTLGLGSGGDLRVVRWSPMTRLLLNGSLLEDSLLLPLPQINIYIFKKVGDGVTGRWALRKACDMSAGCCMQPMNY